MAAIFNLCKKGVKYLRYRLCPRLNVFRMVKTKTTYMPIFMILTQNAVINGSLGVSQPTKMGKRNWNFI